MENDNRPDLTLILAAPRGFCAGVDRAVQIVERALEQFGAPVYVRHEIVHNKYVVEGLRAKGAVFVDELDQIPAGTTQPVIFSAHGVARAVVDDAKARGFTAIDATCPLVTKVHNEARCHHTEGRHVVLIGHKGHAEVEGTMGQLPAGAVTLVETISDVATLSVADPAKLAYCTQTTLSVDDAAQMIAALKARFPAIIGPNKEDICYATTNRQAAVRQAVNGADGLIVIGAPNSSNSRRLVEVGQAAGLKKAQMIQRADDLNMEWFDGMKRVALTAGASAPEMLVDEVRGWLKKRFNITEEPIRIAEENIEFNLPRALRPAAA